MPVEARGNSPTMESTDNPQKGSSVKGLYPIRAGTGSGCWHWPTPREALTIVFCAQEDTELLDDEFSLASRSRSNLSKGVDVRIDMPYSVSFGVGYALGPVAAASVLIWIGVWDLQNLYLYPDNDFVSGLISVAIAVPLTVIVHLMARRENHDNKGVLYVMCISVCGIEYWRGVWMLWETCVLPDNLPLQSVLAVVLGWAILMLTDNFTARIAGPSVMFPHVEEPDALDPAHGDYTDVLEALEAVHATNSRPPNVVGEVDGCPLEKII
jgi:hypothetical protein